MHHMVMPMNDIMNYMQLVQCEEQTLLDLVAATGSQNGNSSHFVLQHKCTWQRLEQEFLSDDIYRKTCNKPP